MMTYTTLKTTHNSPYKVGFGLVLKKSNLFHYNPCYYYPDPNLFSGDLMNYCGL